MFKLNVKIVGILTFISRINDKLLWFKPFILVLLVSMSSKSWAWKKFYKSRGLETHAAPSSQSFIPWIVSSLLFLISCWFLWPNGAVCFTFSKPRQQSHLCSVAVKLWNLYSSGREFDPRPRCETLKRFPTLYGISCWLDVTTLHMCLHSR